MTTLQFDTIKEHIGEHLGYSDYHTVTQDQVQRFADATGDHQWIHIDVERAKAGPFWRTHRPTATSRSRWRPCSSPRS